MKLPRRKFLRLAAGAAALPAVSSAARAQAYPTRPVHIVLGFGAGGTADLIARLMAQGLTERLGQQFIVENKPGAGTNLATGAVIRAPADGYTLGFATPGNAINATLYEKLNFNFIRDITPVAALSRSPLVILVNRTFPAQTLSEFIDYAKARPEAVTFASGGVGTGTHLAGELLKIMAGVDMVHVPYRGGEAPAMNDLLGGQVQAMIPALAVALPHIKAGELRALAVTSAGRTDVLPDIPAAAETLPGYEATVWAGIFAPKSIPTEIINRLNSEINAALADPKIKARFSDLSLTVTPGSPGTFAKFLADETEKWSKVIRTASIRPM